MDIAWSPDGKMIVSGSIDNSVIVWEAKTGESSSFFIYFLNTVV